MKYIILAAGRGTRMEEYTDTIPKSILLFGRFPLLAYHILHAKHAGMTEIVVVKGYKEELIKLKDVKYYVNKDWENSNMVESLITAKEEFDDDIIVAYGDIIYEDGILEGLVTTPGDVVCTVDINWERYWKLRYGTLKRDTESLVMSDIGIISELGKPNPPLSKCDARYVGLLKFTKRSLDKIISIYNEDPEKWKKAYMTDMLQELINRKNFVTAYKINNSWLEFDTKEDYEKANTWLVDGTLEMLGIRI
jgi:L-glutamine-phosphate cytidylyltransferase